MERLREELPQRGWELKKYGPNNSKARTLTLIADHPKKKFGINIEFWDKLKEEDVPSLVISVVSACYQVPDGETVEHY